jgi:hypothetical protein
MNTATRTRRSTCVQSVARLDRWRRNSSQVPTLGTTKTGGLGHLCLQLRPARRCHDDLGGAAVGQPANVDAGLAPQPDQQIVKITAERGRGAGLHRDADGPLEPRQPGQCAAAFHQETEVEEIPRHVRVRPAGRRGAGGAKTLHRRQALGRRIDAAGRCRGRCRGRRRAGGKQAKHRDGGQPAEKVHVSRPAGCI